MKQEKSCGEANFPPSHLVVGIPPSFAGYAANQIRERGGKAVESGRFTWEELGQEMALLYLKVRKGREDWDEPRLQAYYCLAVDNKITDFNVNKKERAGVVQADFYEEDSNDLVYEVQCISDRDSGESIESVISVATKKLSATDRYLFRLLHTNPVCKKVQGESLEKLEETVGKRNLTRDDRVELSLLAALRAEGASAEAMKEVDGFALRFRAVVEKMQGIRAIRPE